MTKGNSASFVSSLGIAVILMSGHAIAAPPVAVVSGVDSHVTKQAYRIADDEESFSTIYREHLGLKKGDYFQTQHLNVDFSRYMVVAVFQGDDYNNRGIKVIDVVSNDRNCVIQYRPFWYQTEGTVDLASSYAFVVIPKTRKPIQIDEDMRDNLSSPPKWSTKATLQIKPEEAPSTGKGR